MKQGTRERGTKGTRGNEGPQSSVLASRESLGRRERRRIDQFMGRCSCRKGGRSGFADYFYEDSIGQFALEQMDNTVLDITFENLALGL